MSYQNPKGEKKSSRFKSVQSWKKCTPSLWNLYNCHSPNCSLWAWIEVRHFVPKSINGQGSLMSNKFYGLVRGSTYSFPESNEQHHFCVRRCVDVCYVFRKPQNLIVQYHWDIGVCLSALTGPNSVECITQWEHRSIGNC